MILAMILAVEPFSLSAFLWSMFVASAISFGLSMAAWYLGHKKQEGPAGIDLVDYKIPTVAEGRAFSVIFGTCEVESYLESWWGDVKTTAIWDYYYRTTKRGGPFNRKRKYYIAGWRYFVGAQFKLCHGPIDGIKRVKGGKECVWPSTNPETLAADGLTSASINLPNVFGGEKAAGGIVGNIDFQYGASSQSKNSYLVSVLGSDIPASRGVVSVILKQIYIGTSPYPKNFSFICKRTDILTDGSTQWYPAKADISGSLNAAHVIRESMTNAEWGLGHSVSLMDDTTFEAGADTLYDEGFGISYEWNPDVMSIDKYIESVLGVINAIVEEDLVTGKFVLKLARDDYVLGDLEEFSNDDIIEIESFDRELMGKITNELTVNYRDTLTNKRVPVTVHDIALIDREGEVISETADFPMITDETLISKIAQRELAQISSSPVPLKVRCKRTMQHIRPNDVFKLAWPPYGIVQLVVRVLTADYGELADGDISLVTIEDIFKMGTAIYAEVPGSQWTDPISDPAAAPHRVLIETPYFEIFKIYGESLAEQVNDSSAFLMVVADAPSDDALDYELLVRDSLTEDFTSDGQGDFTPNGTLVAGLLLNAEDVDITLADSYGLDEELVGSCAKIGEELVLIKTVNVDTAVIGIARCVLDTVPATHSIGVRVWFIEAANYIVAAEYSTGDTPGVKILPRTGKGEFDEASATAYNATAFDDRQVRPYPPGDFKIDGVSYPSEFSGEPVLTWAHRDRTQQTQSIIEHDNVSIGPEAGTTYTIKIYDASDTLRTTVTGLTGVTYTYATATEIADCGSQQTQLRFQLYAVRDGYDSMQMYDITVKRQVSLAGTVAASSSATGELSKILPLEGESHAFSNVSGDLKSFSLEGFVVAESGASGAITMENLSLKGQADAQSGASGDLTVP